MVGICETSDHSNGWSDLRKFLKIGFINSLILILQLINVRDLLEKDYFA